MRLNLFGFNSEPVLPAALAFTHEGAPAAVLNAEQRLRRSVASCFLWEDEFYEDGLSIADRIATLAADVAPEVVAALAVEARERFNLRHAPLLLLSVLTRTGAGTPLVADTIARVIQRADELTEFLASIGATESGRCPSRPSGGSGGRSASSTPTSSPSMTGTARSSCATCSS